MALPLEGIRCLEWGIWHHGVAAGAMLGDLGAEVIKIEEPGRGDPGRGMDTLFGVPLSLPGGRNAFFEASHRNKKSITIDLKKPAGREVVYRLVRNVDVFYTNFRKSLARRLGLDYETLSRYNPRLIYAHASTYGPKGPDSEKRGFDWAGQARSGLMTVTGEPDMPPLPVGGGPIDQMGSITLAYGILVALLARERLGIGQEVHTSMLGSGMWLQYINVTSYLLRGREMSRHSRRRAPNPLGNYYRCADGKWLALLEVQSDRFWGDFCKALGIEELKDDPRFKDVKARRQNREELIAILDRIFATRTREEWLKIFEGYDFAYCPVNTISDLASDPQVLENEYIVDFEYPDLGKVKVMGLPVSLSRTPGRVRSPAPHLGQHTEEVLLEVGGYTWEEIARLREEGVI